MTAKHILGLALINIFGLAIAGAALAEAPQPPSGNANTGKGFAEIKCANCHAVLRDATVSPNIKAPPFTLIAKSKMVSDREIDAWLQTAHTDMPDMQVSTEMRVDIVAYIRSLAPVVQK
jgi:mono/diheme cytochrome c family protein